MAEQAKATKGTPRRVAATVGLRRPSRTASPGAAATGASGADSAETPTPRARSAAKPASSRSRTAAAAAKESQKDSKPVAARDSRHVELRDVLEARLAELSTEYDAAVITLTDLQRNQVADGAGDDQADTGTKTFEREQELSLVHGLHERVQQVEHALARLAEGTYGACERCGNPIPTARLEAFPSVTLCVSCKQIEERR